jgi:hypothetical protein
MHGIARMGTPVKYNVKNAIMDNINIISYLYLYTNLTFWKVYDGTYGQPFLSRETCG